ncbi:eIF2 kinase Gcn2p negative regulator [Xylographa carneopallida]|nr:eIF2 kinase Gcn2p negative regulator [Xylographa carneopallida]
MSELSNEILAIKSIYGEDILQSINQDNLYRLSIPSHPVVLRLHFPPDYPASPPAIDGVESTGNAASKGYGSEVLQVARAILSQVWNPGDVCLYDLIQELESLLKRPPSSHDMEHDHMQDQSLEAIATNPPPRSNLAEPSESGLSPNWVVSSPIIEKKSVFVARACAVASPAEASAYIKQLIATDKKLAKATHNITAYRIRSFSKNPSEKELVYQDCDDDGETAAGGRLLHLLQVMDVWNVLVMVSRWYGGVKLGPDRFRIISAVAREALVEGGFDQPSKVLKSKKN